MNKTVLERFQQVLGLRKPHPWGETTGWNRGVIDRMNKGSLPGPEFLTALGRAENLNLNWLLTGKGMPFRVAVCSQDLGAAALVRALLEEEGWQPYLLRAVDRAAVVLVMPAQYELTGKMFPYEQIEVVAGTIGPETVAELPLETLKVVDVRAEQLLAIERGEVGTWDLVKPDGILQGAKPTFEAALLVADTKANYTSLLTDQERKLLEKFRELKPEDIEQILKLVDRLAGE